MHWLTLYVYRARSRVQHICFPQMMIIAACLSHTSATFSPHCDAFDTPVFITSERLARAQRGLAERTSPDSCEDRRQGICLIWTSHVRWEELMHTERHSETRKKPNGKLWSSGSWQAVGMSIIGKEGVSPELMPPSVHLRNTGVCPLTSGCTSQIHQVCLISQLVH